MMYLIGLVDVYIGVYLDDVVGILYVVLCSWYIGVNYNMVGFISLLYIIV